MMHLELIIRVNEIVAERGEREARSVLAAGMILRYEPVDNEGDAGAVGKPAIKEQWID